MPHVVYVLECRNGKFYVGRCTSERLNARLSEHRNGVGSTFTAVHKGIRFLQSRASDDPLDEDRTVLEWMRIHGVDNVRGGSYSNLQLTDVQIVSLTTQLDHAAGRCLSCGLPGHFAAQCRSDSRHGSRSPQGQGGTNTGTSNASNISNTSNNNNASNTSNACGRCGRYGHATPHCFARWHATGLRLDSDDDDESTSDSDCDGACFRCGRWGHWASQCYARTHADGRLLA
jgi:hypothetical protein